MPILELTLEELKLLHQLLAKLPAIPAETPAPYQVAEGQDLQAILATAKAGDQFQLTGTFLGHFEVPEGVILMGGTLVAPDNGPALIPASRTTVRGVYVTADVQTSELVRYEQVSDVLMDGCRVLGHPTYGAKRGIRVNGANITIRNTAVTECKAGGADSQAICGWAYTKNLLVEDCLLEGAGENVMFGGADAPSAEALPQDILIQRCILRKPDEWRGSGWVVKNLFEVKAGLRVTLRECLLENNWRAGQAGYAVLLKTCHQDGNAPWTEAREILIEGCTIRNVAAAFNLHRDPGANGYFGVPMTKVTLRNNVVDISKAINGGNGYFALINGVDDLTIDHNTVRTDGSTTLYFDGTPCQRFTLTGNILPDNAYGVKGTATGEGNATFAAFAPGATITGNLIITGSPRLYPEGQTAPTWPEDTTGYGAEGRT